MDFKRCHNPLEANNSTGMKRKYNMTPRPKYPSDFEAFWQIYPKKKDKKRCYAWWKANKPNDRDLKMITDAVTAQREEWKAFSDVGLWHEEWKHPATWLNGECWEDEIAMPAVAKPTQKPVPFELQSRRCSARLPHMPSCGKQAVWQGCNDMGYDYYRCEEHKPEETCK